MFSAKKIHLLFAVALAFAPIASPAAAKEWTRKTAHGGEIGRDIGKDGGVITGSTTRTGPNGGTYTSNSKCVGGVVDRCARSYSGTGPNGNSFSGNRASARGPFGGRSVGSFTGPNGNTGFGFRRWRR